MKVALLGGQNGFVGRNVAEVLKRTGINFITASRTNGVDFTSLDQTTSFFKREKIF